MTRTRAFLLAGLVVSLLLAGLVSGFASSSPDGLEKVAEEQGFSDTAEEHAFADGPLADYSVSGVDDERVSTGLAGVLGVTITFAFGLGLFALVRRGRERSAEDDQEPQPSRAS